MAIGETLVPTRKGENDTEWNALLEPFRIAITSGVAWIASTWGETSIARPPPPYPGGPTPPHVPRLLQSQ